MPEQPQNNNNVAGASGVFVQTLAAMNGGQVLTDLDDAIREATKAALGATQKAKVILELTVIPNGTGVGDTPLIKIVDKIKTVTPKPARDKEPVFFADDSYNPTRRNPNQGEIKLEVVDGGHAPKLKSDSSAKVPTASGQ